MGGVTRRYEWASFAHRRLDGECVEGAPACYAVKIMGIFRAQVIHFGQYGWGAWVAVDERLFPTSVAMRWLGLYPDATTAIQACERQMPGARERDGRGKKGVQDGA